MIGVPVETHTAVIIGVLAIWPVVLMLSSFALPALVALKN